MQTVRDFASSALEGMSVSHTSLEAQAAMQRRTVSIEVEGCCKERHLPDIRRPMHI